MDTDPSTYHQNKEQWIEAFRDKIGEDAYKNIENVINKIVDYFIDILPVILYNNQAIPVPVKTYGLQESVDKEDHINQIIIGELVKLKETNHILFLHSLEKLYFKNMTTGVDEVSYKLRYIAINQEEVN
jgi:hypothetical protein